ncbi:MAG: hypothetical protein ACI9LN_002853 [Saprospiraceae bacterium]|jgi:hypothetical protein
MKNRHFRFFFCINLTPNKSLLKKIPMKNFTRKNAILGLILGINLICLGQLDAQSSNNCYTVPSGPNLIGPLTQNNQNTENATAIHYVRVYPHVVTDNGNTQLPTIKYRKL